MVVMYPSQQVGSTPLHYAAGSGHGDAIELLVEAGADIDRRNTEVCAHTHCDRSGPAEVASFAFRSVFGVYQGNREQP